jgi:hypothetical protein
MMTLMRSLLLLLKMDQVMVVAIALSVTMPNHRVQLYKTGKAIMIPIGI